MQEKIKAGRENKPHIGIFGRCNAGKSTLLNFIAGGDVAIVSDVAGTTTDVVRKSYEIPGFAPVIFVDTAGVGDSSALSAARLERTYEAMLQVDLAILVYVEWGNEEHNLLVRLKADAVPILLVQNIVGGNLPDGKAALAFDFCNGSTREHNALIAAICTALPEGSYKAVSMLGGLVGQGETVVLVCPIDSEAPAGRMILPQMQAVREALDRRALALVVQPSELEAALGLCPAPALVVCDSQVYKEVREVLPQGLEVTTFSILLAAAKGDMDLYLQGLEAVDRLRDGSRVLIAENCSHQISCDDIGRVKIPAWLSDYTGKYLTFDFVSGLAPLPRDMRSYSLMIQCGGCMVTRSALRNRIRRAAAAGVPVTNYGMLIKKIR